MRSSQTDIKQLKAEARVHFLALRKSLSADCKRSASKKICDGIYALIKDKNINTVLVYSPVRGEVDVMPLVRRLWENGFTVAFPRSVVSGTRLDFFIVHGEHDLAIGEYSIPEPTERCRPLEDIDGAICLVPALSVDRDGFRLGYGKGYYDRFLCSHKLLAVCPMYADMLSKNIPHESTDMTVDIIQTEKEVICPRG